jgi:hypothetical protein
MDLERRAALKTIRIGIKWLPSVIKAMDSDSRDITEWFLQSASPC